MKTYVARIMETISIRPGTRESIRVGIFRTIEDREEKVGEYVRNYPSLFNTFFPFRVENQDYALYSPHYTATRIMHLPDCLDVGGEEPSGGFCPVDYYIPSYVYWEYLDEHDTAHRYKLNNPKPQI